MNKTCQICQHQSGRGKYALSNHVKNEHGLSEIEYYNEFYREEGEGTCKGTKCNKKTNYSYRYKRFNDYCSRSCQMHAIAMRPEQREIRRQNALRKSLN